MRIMMTLVLVAMLVPFAFAQDEIVSPIAKGATEMTALGFYNFGQGTADDTWALGLGYGVMYSDNLEIGGRLMGSNDMWLLLPNATWYFTSPGATTVPYVAVDLGYMFSDIDGLDDDFAWGGRVGAKMFTSSNTAFFAEFEYLDFGADDAQEQINLGMAFYR